MSENTPEAEVVTAASDAPQLVRCEPSGPIYCDDYEAIVGAKPGATVVETVTKDVTGDDAEFA